MAHYNTVLSQLLVHIPRHHFETLVQRHHGDRYVKTFTTWAQFTTLLYAQASGKDSLRDIQHGLAVQAGKLYHLGLPDRICRSTLADANATRDWRIFEGLFYRLLQRCRSLTPKHKFRFKNPLYTLDATVIDLCLSVFPWAKFRTTKGALKLHYQFDHAGQIPTFLTVTTGKCHEIRVVRQAFPLLPDSIYCFDKGYVDFAWFRRVHETHAVFVTRAKDNLAYQVTGQQNPTKNKCVLRDLAITLTGRQSHPDFPYPLRLIYWYDAEANRVFQYLTNNLTLAAATIAQIYKARWDIEVFFKWIKQHLKIKTFLGTSKTAVLTQIWVAMCYYLLLAYMKYQTRYGWSLFYLHRMIRETLLERISLIDLLHLTERRLPHARDQSPQLCFAF